MKVRMEIHKIQNRKTIDRINENETDKFSATLMKKKERKFKSLESEIKERTLLPTL